MGGFVRGAPVAAAAVAFLVPTAVMAQEGQGAARTQPQASDAIIVTARRRAESQQDVPIAVTVFDTAALEKRQVEDISDLDRLTPNLNLLESTGINGSSTAFAFIRGIGQSEGFLQNDPGVGVYLDGVYLGRTQGSILQVIDPASIEILRGPQGTLFGRNTIGGAILLNSREPSSFRRGNLELEAGNEGQLRISGSVDVPLDDRFAASLSLVRTEHDGLSSYRAVGPCPACVPGDLTNAKTTAGRLALIWRGEGESQVSLAADYSLRDALPIARRLTVYDEAAERNSIFFGPPPGVPGPTYSQAVAATYGVDSIQRFVNRQANTHQSLFPGKDEQRAGGISLSATVDFGEVTLRSISAWRTLDIDTASDGDGSPVMINTILGETLDQSQFSQELQVFGNAWSDRIDWIAGLFYFDEHANGDVEQTLFNTEALGFFCFDPANPLASCPIRQQETTLDVTNLAAYVHASIALTEQLSVSAGIRYSIEDKSFFSRVANVRPQPTITIDLDDTFDSFTPRIGIEYRHDANLLLYASYSQGYKSGTFNNGFVIPPLPAPPDTVAPEQVEAYEIGLKSDWLNDRLRVNVALYRNDYTDQQSQASIPGGFAFINLSESRIQGGEIELTARPWDGLTLQAAIGYTDAEIIANTAPVPGVPVVIGAPLQRVPEWDVTTGIGYERDIGARTQLVIWADYAYRSAQEGDNASSPLLRVNGYGTANARIALDYGESWQVSLFAKNLFDETYETARGSSDPNVYAVAVDGQPRLFGVGLRYRY